jgi:glycosyltransferase involved in cell wall biosynthesis
MKISVIVPNYNHAKYLKQRLNSILCQSYKDFELIILDDCSTDVSCTIIDEYVGRYPQIRSYYNNYNTGNPFKQWDFGVNQAKGEFIWIAESDDFAESDFLEKTVKILINHKNVGLVYCNSKVIDENKNIEYIVSERRKHIHEKKWLNDYINNGKNEISDYLFLNNIINNVSGVLFRRDRYIKAGYADHSMKYCGDWFLYVKMLLISDIAYISNPLNTIRFHAGNTFHDYFIKSYYLREVREVYSFILKNIDISIKKRLFMFKNILRIFFKKFIKILILKLNRNFTNR